MTANTLREYSLASQSERVPQSCFYVKVASLSHGEYTSVTQSKINYSKRCHIPIGSPPDNTRIDQLQANKAVPRNYYCIVGKRNMTRKKNWASNTNDLTGQRPGINSNFSDDSFLCILKEVSSQFLFGVELPADIIDR